MVVWCLYKKKKLMSCDITMILFRFSFGYFHSSFFFSFFFFSLCSSSTRWWFLFVRFRVDSDKDLSVESVLKVLQERHKKKICTCKRLRWTMVSGKYVGAFKCLVFFFLLLLFGWWFDFFVATRKGTMVRDKPSASARLWPIVFLQLTCDRWFAPLPKEKEKDPRVQQKATTTTTKNETEIRRDSLLTFSTDVTNRNVYLTAKKAGIPVLQRVEGDFLMLLYCSPSRHFPF